jgi:hypothetical protein
MKDILLCFLIFTGIVLNDLLNTFGIVTLAQYLVKLERFFMSLKIFYEMKNISSISFLIGIHSKSRHMRVEIISRG